MEKRIGKGKVEWDRNTEIGEKKKLMERGEKIEPMSLQIREKSKKGSNSDRTDAYLYRKHPPNVHNKTGNELKTQDKSTK